MEQPPALAPPRAARARRRIGDVVLADRATARAAAAGAPRRAPAGGASPEEALLFQPLAGCFLATRSERAEAQLAAPERRLRPFRAEPGQRALDRAIPARCGRPAPVARAPARRRHRAAPRRGSARRRAAANAPRGRAGRCSSTCARSGSASSSLLRPEDRHSGAVHRRARPSARRAPARSGSAQASARIRTGDCSPLAPCTVITRTASSGAEGSRTISTSPRANQSRKACSEASALLSNSSARG